MLRFFPPVVTGTIILVIGVSLMRVGINWIFGLPLGPTAPKLVDPAQAEWLKTVTDLAGQAGSAIPAIPGKLALVPTIENAAYAPLSHIGIAGVVLVVDPGDRQVRQGFHRQHRRAARHHHRRA